MKWIADFPHPKGARFEIEYDENVGYYLYVYGDKAHSYDDLQDTLHWAMTVAKEEFGVPMDAWKRVE